MTARRECSHCRGPKDGYWFKGQPDPTASYCKQCARYLSAALAHSASAPDEVNEP